jgi:hypothetical protein
MTPGEHAVLAASAYAEEVGEGQGHWLRLRMVDGRELRGPCRRPEQGVMRMEIYTEEHGVNHAEPVWVVLAQVASVQIEW